jgi:hypothetical protein
MSNRLEKIKVREMQPKDILEIIEKKGLSPDELDKLQHKRDTLSSQEIKALEKKGNQLPKNLLLQMSEVHFEVRKPVAKVTSVWRAVLILIQSVIYPSGWIASTLHGKRTQRRCPQDCMS